MTIMLAFRDTPGMNDVHAGNIQYKGKNYPITLLEQEKYKLNTVPKVSMYFFTMIKPALLWHRADQDKPVITLYKQPLMHGYPCKILTYDQISPPGVHLTPEKETNLPGNSNGSKTAPREDEEATESRTH